MTIAEWRTGPSGKLVIGLTGPIASGKSTVAEMLRQRGAETIDADRIYRSLIQPGSPLLQAIVSRFGQAVLRANGELNRPELASIVFGDPIALADLDHLTHPPIAAEIRCRIEVSKAPVVVVEAVKLAQAGLAEDLDALWLVTADEKIRALRLMSRDDLDLETSRSRVAAVSGQLPSGIRPDATIDTSRNMATTIGAVDAAWHALLESHSRNYHARLRDAEEVQ